MEKKKILKIENLNKFFVNRNNYKIALDNISFDVTEGDNNIWWLNTKLQRQHFGGYKSLYTPLVYAPGGRPPGPYDATPLTIL